MLLRLNSRGPEVLELQQGLAALGFHPGGADGTFGVRTEAAVEKFQSKVGLLPDGIFGRESLKEWNKLVKAAKHPRYQFGEPVLAPDPVPDLRRALLTWEVVPADVLAGGGDHLILRSDAAEAYRGLYTAVHAVGGIISTAGGKRALSAKAGPARSKKSFHYTGRAFDLATGSAMRSVPTDRFIAVRNGDSRFFTVWCKTESPAVPVVTLLACVCKTLKNAQGKRVTQLFYEIWTGRAFNFTALAKEHGFERIPGRGYFFEGGDFGGAEYWHFSWRAGMVSGVTTFGEEILKGYTLPEAQRFIYWDEVKDAVYGVSFFG